MNETTFPRFSTNSSSAMSTVTSAGRSLLGQSGATSSSTAVSSNYQPTPGRAAYSHNPFPLEASNNQNGTNSIFSPNSTRPSLFQNPFSNGNLNSAGTPSTQNSLFFNGKQKNSSDNVTSVSSHLDMFNGNTYSNTSEGLPPFTQLDSARMYVNSSYATPFSDAGALSGVGQTFANSQQTASQWAGLKQENSPGAPYQSPSYPLGLSFRDNNGCQVMGGNSFQAGTNYSEEPNVGRNGSMHGQPVFNAQRNCLIMAPDSTGGSLGANGSMGSSDGDDAHSGSLNNHNSASIGNGTSSTVSGKTGKTNRKSNGTSADRKQAPTIATGRRSLKNENTVALIDRRTKQSACTIFVEPDEAERRMKRRERNRRSAQKCRERKVQRTQELQAQVETLRIEASNLLRELDSWRLQAKNCIQLLRDHCPNVPIPQLYFACLAEDERLLKSGVSSLCQRNGNGPESNGPNGRMNPDSCHTNSSTLSNGGSHQNIPMDTERPLVIQDMYGVSGNTGSSNGCLGNSSIGPMHISQSCRFPSGGSGTTGSHGSIVGSPLRQMNSNGVGSIDVSGRSISMQAFPSQTNSNGSQGSNSLHTSQGSDRSTSSMSTSQASLRHVSRANLSVDSNSSSNSNGLCNIIASPSLEASFGSGVGAVPGSLAVLGQAGCQGSISSNQSQSAPNSGPLSASSSSPSPSTYDVCFPLVGMDGKT